MVSRKLRASKTKKQASLQAYCMLAPQMIGLAVFTILPILWVIRLSFFEFNGFQSDFIGFDNFVRAFTRDPYYWRALLNTCLLYTSRCV